MKACRTLYKLAGECHTFVDDAFDFRELFCVCYESADIAPVRWSAITLNNIILPRNIHDKRSMDTYPL